MAVITKIEVQNDRKNDLIFILIKVKAKSTDLVDQVILIKHGLQKGLEIDEIELGNILYNEEVQKHIYKQSPIYPIK